MSYFKSPITLQHVDGIDPNFWKEVDDDMPKFNPRIASGYACSEMAGVEEYIHAVFKEAAKDFPEGLTYDRGYRCDPYEVYTVMSTRNKNRKNKTVYELSHSDTYTVKYKFMLYGNPLPETYLFLPYVHEAGIITIKGSKFAISPVLGDMSISVGADDIFIYMNKTRITFKVFKHMYVSTDGVESEYVVWCRAHNNSVKPTLQNKKSSNIHYLFAKYGLTETFARYGRTQVVVGSSREINTKNYPEDKWVLCQSTGMKPVGKSGKHTSSDIILAVPRVNYNHMVKSMIVAFFYLVDHFPNHVTPDTVDNVDTWCLLLGYCIFKSTDTIGRTVNHIKTHLQSVDSFVDGMVRGWLQKDGIQVEDVYELFAFIVDKFDFLINVAAANIAAVDNKRLIVLRYILHDITEGIFKLLFELTKLARKSKDKMVEMDVKKVFNSKLKPTLIHRINRNHAEVSSVMSASDCPVFKITSNMIMQTDMSGTKSAKGRGSNFDDSKALHSSLAMVCQFNNLPKSNISGRGRINQYVFVRGEGIIERNPKLYPLLDNVENTIHR